MAERKYKWYLEPLDDGYTNAVISQKYPADANFFNDKLCADGAKRNLWQVDYSFISAVRKGKNYQNLKFNVFVQEGEGKIRLWKLLKK